MQQTDHLRVVLIGASLLAVVLVVGLGMGVYLAGCAMPGDSSSWQAEGEVYSREEFSKLVMSKTRDEVRQAIGPPRRTSEDSEAEYWHYRGRTRDPHSNRTDSDIQLVFREGRVDTVNY